MKLNIVIIGLSVTSSWGNGHATTYRALIEALVNRGHQVTFLERDVPWYRSHRDLTKPSNWTIKLYQSLQDIPKQHTTLIRNANLVILGSYVPDGVAIAEWVTSHAQGVTAFYDIDTPVTLASLDGGLEYLSAAMIPRFDLYLSFSGGPVPGMIEDAYGSPMARVLYCSADSGLYRPHPVTKQWSLGYLGTYSNDRQPSLEQLLLAPANTLPDQQFVVAGSKYPDQLVWPDNVSRIEHLSQLEHPSFYSQQRFTLNLTRADMRALGFSPSVRLFEAAACGTPVISDRWPGIETIFEPGTEILLVSDAREVSDILRDIPEERRLTIAAKARRRVLAEHTPDHRARQLEAYYLEAAGRRRRSLPHSRNADHRSCRNVSGGNMTIQSRINGPRGARSTHRTLVTGGAGFIGSHLCDSLLQRGDRVICADNLFSGSMRNVRPLLNHPNFRFIEHDVREPIDIDGDVDRIYNLACPASPRHYQRDPIGTMKTCVIGTINVLEFARRKSSRILQASTSEVYGDPEVHPQPESYVGHVNPIGPRACYDEGKRAAETLMFDYHRRYGLEVKVARIFNTYGPRMLENDGRVVSNFIVQALRGEPVTVYGNGTQTRSFCFVDDLIGGLELLMESPASITGPCNLGNPHEVAIEEIAREVLAYTKSSSSLCFEPLPKDDPKRRKPVIETALRKLGWRPRVPLRDGLQATIAYFTLRTATPEFVTVPGPSPGPPSQGRGRLALASQQ